MSSTTSNTSLTGSATSATSSTTSSTFTITNKPPELPFGSSTPAASSTQSIGNGAIPNTTASSLYLYTFLATLVLLLSVSGAVVIRSLMLRVRQRRAIEEAIRNGTYVPPDQLARRQAPVKPTMFDAHLDGVDYSKGGGKSWSGMVPVAAQFIPSPNLTLPTPVSSRAPASSRSILSRFREYRLPDILGDLLPRDGSRLTVPEGPSQLEMAEAAFARRQSGTAPAPAPSSVRMAFLIAMPDPSRPHPYPPPHSHSHSFSSSSSATEAGGRPSTSSSTEKGKERDSSPTVFTQEVIDEEPELPYLEFGIAELPVRPPREGPDGEGNEQDLTVGSEKEAGSKRENGSYEVSLGQPDRGTS